MMIVPGSAFIPYVKGSGDPYIDYVVLLMHFDPPDDYEDEMNPARTFTEIRSVNVQTSEVKFGSGALRVYYYDDGGPGYIYTDVTDEFDIQEQDFTVEAWIYRMNGLSPIVICSNYTNPKGWAFYAIDGVGTTAKTLQFRSIYGTATEYSYTFNSVDSFLNRWVYVKAVRKGSSFYLQCDDEVSTDFGDIGTVYGAESGDLVIGKCYHSNWGGDAYIDDLRITVGYGRDSSTVPTDAFPDP